jgi:PAS domain-containing protein
MKYIMDKRINSPGGAVTELSVPVGFFLLSGPENKIIFASQSMTGLSGKAFDSIVNKPVSEVFPEQLARNINRILKNVYQNRKMYHMLENPATTFHEGKLRTIYQTFSFEPYMDVAGNISGTFAVVTDVTEQVHARQREEQAEREQNEKKRKEMAEGRFYRRGEP